MKTLGLEDVSVRFDRVQALDRVAIELSAGEALMLIGPNGAGKSTLMRVLLGLVRPTSGRMVVDGAECSVDRSFKTKLGYLPEAVAFSPNLTGQQVLNFFARARGVTSKRVAATLERIGLTHARKRKVRGYSRGMLQRLGIGVAILSEPELLVLDEPTGGLDQEGLEVLWALLQEWREAGRLVLLATHDLALLERRVSRICVLQSGKKLVDDVPEALRLSVDLPHRVTFTLSEGAGALVDAIEAWSPATLVDSAVSAKESGRLQVEIAGADLLALIDLRAQYPDAVESIRVIEPGMDEVYEHLLATPEVSA